MSFSLRKFSTSRAEFSEVITWIGRWYQWSIYHRRWVHRFPNSHCPWHRKSEPHQPSSKFKFIYLVIYFFFISFYVGEGLRRSRTQRIAIPRRRKRIGASLLHSNLNGVHCSLWLSPAICGIGKGVTLTHDLVSPVRYLWPCLFPCLKRIPRPHWLLYLNI